MAEITNLLQGPLEIWHEVNIFINANFQLALNMEIL